MLFTYFFVRRIIKNGVSVSNNSQNAEKLIQFHFDRAVLSFLRFLFHLGRVVHLHKNGFALRLVLKHRQNRTRKWPVGDINPRSVYFESPHFYFDDFFSIASPPIFSTCNLCLANYCYYLDNGVHYTGSLSSPVN